MIAFILGCGVGAALVIGLVIGACFGLLAAAILGAGKHGRH